MFTMMCGTGKPLLHDYDNEDDYECENVRFELILKAGTMDHFPERLGFLFRKYKGETACETAFDELSIEKAM